MRSAVLFLVFNRVETTAKVFEAIRQARPPKLYVAADAPRAGRNEEEQCNAVRKIATAIDWDCELYTLFQTSNKGMRGNTEEAFTWFLDAEGEGILLEDDTLPTAEFFTYCDELLERFRHDERVACIGACNFNFPHNYPHYSYFFSKNVATWGWGTWKRVWDKHKEFEKMQQEVLAANNSLDGFYPDRYENITVREKLNEVKQGKVNTWDFYFHMSTLMYGMMSVIPTRNMMVNLGFGGGTNTLDLDHPSAKLVHEEMELPLIHPDYMPQSRTWEDTRFYKNQKLDELMSYRELIRMIYNKTTKRLRGIKNI